MRYETECGTDKAIYLERIEIENEKEGTASNVNKRFIECIKLQMTDNENREKFNPQQWNQIAKWTHHKRALKSPDTTKGLVLAKISNSTPNTVRIFGRKCSMPMEKNAFSTQFM